ncbi:MAG TPA: S49 family peptidase, partial [Phenylobacterium sp.]|nr:S49 family peptidase [Phenylobacterium sp.]
GAFSLGQEFSPAQRAAFARWMDRIYDNFVARVAEGRKLPVERVREIAKGHVWTGVQARQLGLVDQIGGFYDAVDKAKSLAGLSGEVRLKRMSPKSSPIETLQKLIGVSAASVRAVGAAAGILDQPEARALLTDLDQARLRGQGALVLAPVRLP